MKHTVFLVLAVLVVLAGCRGGQREAVTEYMEASHVLLEEWMDTYDRATTTSRIALSPVIGDLQQIKRNFAALEGPEDCESMHENVLIAMNYYIDGFMAFMADEDDDVIENKFVLADRSMEFAMSDLQELQEKYLE